MVLTTELYKTWLLSGQLSLPHICLILIEDLTYKNQQISFWVIDLCLFMNDLLSGYSVNVSLSYQLREKFYFT